MFKQCFLIAETGFSHVESRVCLACLLCVSSCLGSETMCVFFFFFLSQQQSPDTIPGPSAGPTVHKVEKHNTHGRTHTHMLFFSSSSLTHKHTCTHTLRCPESTFEAQLSAHFQMHPYDLAWEIFQGITLKKKKKLKQTLGLI